MTLTLYLLETVDVGGRVTFDPTVSETVLTYRVEAGRLRCSNVTAANKRDHAEAVVLPPAAEAPTGTFHTPRHEERTSGTQFIS